MYRFIYAVIRLLYFIMERMKVEIDSEELKRLKSREEKYLAYMDMLSYRWEDETYVDALCWKVAELEEENKNLKSDLSECECSFWFESDEVWFWKWEYKRLKKWIKDHCKWYWNLFPEDEMKRQWKKADKKRK